MALSARKKLDVLAKAIALQDMFRTQCNSDTGQWRGVIPAPHCVRAGTPLQNSRRYLTPTRHIAMRVGTSPRRLFWLASVRR